MTAQTLKNDDEASRSTAQDSSQSESSVDQSEARTNYIFSIAVAMIAVHTALRAWQLFGGWFYGDDFIFLEDALNRDFGLNYLFTPHDSQLMPVGVAVSWVVAHAGTFSWGTAAAITVGLQLVAAVMCFLALRTLFGERPAILVPLAFYLFSAMSPEAFHWWAAALNAVPFHIAFFTLVYGITRWTRTRQLSAAIVTVAALTLAALSGPRGLVMTIPIALLVLVFLTDGTWRDRPLAVVKRDWPIAVPLALVAGSYLLLYRQTTPSPVESGNVPMWELLGNLVVQAWLPTLVGGPWRWTEYYPPVSFANPPTVLLVIAIAVVVALVLWSLARNRSATLGALLIVSAQLGATYAALVVGRAVNLGSFAGLTNRYLTDTLPVTALCIGLATIPLAGASGVTRPRDWNLRPVQKRLLVGLGAVTLLGSLVSTVLYAQTWHADYPARAYVKTVGLQLADDPAPIADVEVPDDVLPRVAFPNNLPSHMLRPYGDRLNAVERGNDLKLLNQAGELKQAAVSPSASSEQGPVEGCGFRVDDSTTVRIEIPREDVPVFWWISAGYLASGDGQLEVQVYGQRPVTIDVYGGLHTYLLRGEKQFSSVRIRSLTPGLAICIDSIDVGQLVVVE